MIPLQELLRHVGLFLKTPGALLRTQYCGSPNNSNVQPGMRPSAYWDNTRAEANSFRYEGIFL
jgi:hypothetical protein